MATRAELRTALRRRLEDGGSAPLWDDAALNEAIAEGVRGYGLRVPAEATAAVVVAAGATRIALGGVAGGRVVRVLDADGGEVPRWPAGEAGDGAGHGPGVVGGQAWRAWGGEVVLAEPAGAGTWQVEHRAGRAAPVDDVAQVDLLAGDEEVVLALAAAAALRRRAAEEAKRGVRGDAARLAEAAEAAAEHRLRGRRVVRGRRL